MEHKLYRWSVVGDLYQAPEIQTIRLCGFRDSEEKRVITSTVESIDGRRITTNSGSVYILQDIDPDYLGWMFDNGYTYDPDDPIKVIKQKA